MPCLVSARVYASPAEGAQPAPGTSMTMVSYQLPVTPSTVCQPKKALRTIGCVHGTPCSTTGPSGMPSLLPEKLCVIRYLPGTLSSSAASGNTDCHSRSTSCAVHSPLASTLPSHGDLAAQLGAPLCMFLMAVSA